MMFSATRGYLKTASPRHQPPWVFMVSTYLTRSPKKITTRNTSARKIYTASRWVCLQHSGTNMYKSHWKSSSFPSFEVKKKHKSEWNQHPYSRCFFLDELHNYTKLIISISLWAVKSMGLSGHPGSACFPEPKRCQNGAKDEAGRLPTRRRKSLLDFLPTENPGALPHHPTTTNCI